MSRRLALIPLLPQYWDMYRDGSKIWELRKVTHSPRGVDGLIIYATAPVSRIVGEVDLISTHVGYVNDVWDVVKDGCGITRKQYDLYYQDQEIAIAYRLGNVYEYPTSLGMLPAPQGYRYLRQEMYHQFRCQTGRPRLVHASCGCAD